jgi:hypothetical protein
MKKLNMNQVSKLAEALAPHYKYLVDLNKSRNTIFGVVVNNAKYRGELIKDQFSNSVQVAGEVCNILGLSSEVDIDLDLGE